MTWHYPQHSEACGIFWEDTCQRCLMLWIGTTRWKEIRTDVQRDVNEAVGAWSAKESGRCQRSD